MVPKIRQANRPTCHNTMRSQNGSLRAGPLGQLAKLSFIEARKAWVSPVPSVKGMLVGIDDGTIHPRKAMKMTTGLSLYSTPSEISNSIRGTDTVDTRGATALRTLELVVKANPSERTKIVEINSERFLVS